MQLVTSTLEPASSCHACARTSLLRPVYLTLITCLAFYGCATQDNRKTARIHVVENAENCIFVGAVKGNNVLTSTGDSFAVDDAISQASNAALKLGANAIHIKEIVSVPAGTVVTADALQCPD